MCLRQSRVRLTAKEAVVAEESLSVYCKPVELYNILQRRAIQNPSFLQRCLDYKIRAKRKRRIQITVSFSRTLNAELEPHNVFPLHALIARPIADVTSGEHSAIYRLSRAAILSTFSELGKNDQTQAQFVIPEIKKLRADAQFGNLIIIIISHAEREGAYHENHCLKVPEELKSFSSKLEGNCLMGKLPLEPLYSLLEKRVTSSLEHIAELQSTVNFLPSIFEPTNLDKDNFLAFRTQNADSMSSYQVQVSLSAQGIGAREKSPYDSYTYDGVPTSSLPHIIRLRTGNVIFNYRYYNNTLQKTEVTEDFCCPFCLVQCASFKGLRCHLISFHDLFNFEFWVTEEFQAVNVSVRTGAWGSEVVSSGVDPRLQTFDYCSKLKRRRITKNPVQNVNNVHPHFLESESPGASRDGSHKGQLQKEDDTYSSRRPITHPRHVRLPNGLNDSCSSREEKSSNELLDGRHKLESYVSENHLPSESKECFVSSPKITGICAISDQAFTSNESGSNLAPTTILQFAKTRKLSVERGDPRNRALLQKRPFFHSHRAQPMALEQVFSDRDSEDEVDDDIADFEDRKMLDDFVDVTTYEKQIMHLWNSFVRKQRVLADGHIPWACEAFSRLHGLDLVRVPALLRCWRLLMVKLWNHSLLDARTMNNCSLILETCQDEGFCPEEGTVLAKTGV